MVTFSYRARTLDGELVEGTWTAATEQEALDEIREQGQFVIELTRPRIWSLSLPSIGSHRRVLPAGLLFRQLAVLLQSGMQLHESLTALIGDGQGREKELLSGLRQGIEHGQPFSEVLRSYGDIFPPLAVEVVAVGESSGRLPEMMQQLADWMEQEFRAREKMKTVLAYPAILFAETIAIACFLTIVVLPAFASLFLSMNAALPLPTRLLLDGSTFVQEHGMALLALLFVLCVGIFRLSQRPRMRQTLDRLRLFVPVFGQLQREIVWMRTFRALGVLLSCAIPLDEACEQASRIADNRYIEARLQAAANSVRQGFALTEVFASERSMPFILYELLRTGETVGKLSRLFQEGAAYAAMMADHHASRLQAMAEPAAYLIIFAIVGTIVAAVALPWLDMMTLFF